MGLEEELSSQLDQAGRVGIDDLSKCGAANIAIDGLRPEKLRMVENIKCFEPKLK
jgi:hypothetical protein